MGAITPRDEAGVRNPGNVILSRNEKELKYI